MAKTSSKIRTSINISRHLLHDIRASGISNHSQYFEDLAKADLYDVKKMSKDEATQIAELRAKLVDVRKQWQAYLKKTGATA